MLTVDAPENAPPPLHPDLFGPDTPMRAPCPDDACQDRPSWARQRGEDPASYARRFAAGEILARDPRTRSEGPVSGPLSCMQALFPGLSADHRETVDLEVISNRAERWRLRSEAGRLLGGRVDRCGRIPIGPVEIGAGHATGARYAGLETCSNIWACPVCAPKIANERALRLEAAAQAHRLEGGRLVMVTATLKHRAGQPLETVADRLTGAWRRLQQRRPWRETRDAHGVRHHVRALEVTHGANGWHPHLHVLLFVRGKGEAADLAADLWPQWRAQVAKEGGEARRGAFDVREVDVADYVAKWGAVQEVALATGKANGKGRSPWQLLAASAAGERQAGALFAEYGATMKGRTAMQTSRGLLEDYGVTDMTEDELRAAHDPDFDPDERRETVLALSREEWAAVRKRGLAHKLLEVIEAAMADLKAGGCEDDERLFKAARSAGSRFLQEIAPQGPPRADPPPE